MISVKTISDTVVPRLKQCRVITATLTGGEPFLHPDIIDIVKTLRNADLAVSICTNATIISSNQMESLSKIGDVRINVSLDGFRSESHGKFRGNRDSFDITIGNMKKLGHYNLLKGVLATPNALAQTDEYAQICEFAIANRATYLLMNPLATFGRGVASKATLGSPRRVMEEIRDITGQFRDLIEIVYIRFPNRELPLAQCEAGNIIYVFADGAVSICPYMVFAARNAGSKHKPEEFIVGNILGDVPIREYLDKYDLNKRYHLGNNESCKSCSLADRCGKECPAAIVASGQGIEGVDRELCPIIAET
jgi:radical SAM protein with 4Fe4S-binding SPASM domain